MRNGQRLVRKSGASITVVRPGTRGCMASHEAPRANVTPLSLDRLVTWIDRVGGHLAVFTITDLPR